MRADDIGVANMERFADAESFDVNGAAVNWNFGDGVVFTLRAPVAQWLELADACEQSPELRHKRTITNGAGLEVRIIYLNGLVRILHPDNNSEYEAVVLRAALAIEGFRNTARVLMPEFAGGVGATPPHC